MRPGKRRFGVLCGLAAVLCLIVGTALTSAGAAPGGQVQVALDGAGFTDRPAGPLLDMSGLVPGTAASADVGVRSALDAPAALRLRMIAVHDDEHGCTTAEARVDHSCGTGNGELGDSLVFTLDAAKSPTGTYRPTWTGTAAQLERGIDADVVVPAGADRWLHLTGSLPASVTDVVQSDGFTFTMRIELFGHHGAAGVTVGPKHPASGTGGLAFTGVSIALLASGGAFLLAAGVLVLSRSRLHD